MEPIGIVAIVGISVCGCGLAGLARLYGRLGTLKVSRSSTHLSDMVSEEEPDDFSSKPKSSAISFGS